MTPPPPIKLCGPRQRNFAKERIDAAPTGWVVTIKEPKRTDPQSKRFWAMIDDLVAANPNGLGYDKDTWKAAVLSALGREVRVVQGIEGEPVVVGYSSRRLTVREMSTAIEIMFKYGAEKGVIWSDDAR